MSFSTPRPLRTVPVRQRSDQSDTPAGLESLEPRLLFTAVPLITEFLASNDSVLDDEDGDSSDWIEIYNDGDTVLNLDGWHLTDDAGNLTKWAFPDVSVAAGQYLVVFASGKDRADNDGTELHTGFALSAGGEYLALVEADGSTIAFEYAPQYPAQSSDVSYGLADVSDANSAAFMVQPTPGAANIVTGPIIESVTKDPPQPTASQSLVIEASVSDNAGNGIARVDLHYRVNYGSESSVQVFDNGAGSDTVAGDGIYTGVISSGLYAAGDMVRWYVTAEDDGGTVSRAPTFIDQSGNNQSAEYLGTVVAESISTSLPVFQWFTQDESASHTRNGTRASVYYNGRFYDNIFVRQRGGATNSSASQKFDFNKGDKLFVSEEIGFVGEINLNGNGSDSSYLRQVMGFDAHTEAGNASSAAFHAYMTLNGSFDRVGVWIEQVDDDFLDRQGYDPAGDLYKLVQRSNLGPAIGDADTGVEKKTNDENDLSSFEALVAGVSLPTQAQRQAFIRDFIDIPQFLNYFAVRTIQQQADDVRKNFYLYVDNTPDGDGLWRIFPWDLDWTFDIVGGHDNNDSERTEHPFFGVEDFPTADGFDQWNVLYEALLETTEIQEMYLRRVRTMMDQLYGGPSGGTTWFANYINTHFPDIDPHLGSSVTNGKNSLLADVEERRNALYTTYSSNIPGYSVVIPGAQPTSPALSIGVIDHSPLGDQDFEYIEVVNNNGFAVDVSGWTVEGGISHTFSPGTVIAAGSTLYLTPSSSAFRARPTGPSGGQQLFVQQWDSGHLSSFGEAVVIRRLDGSVAAADAYTGDPTPEQEHLRIAELHYNPTGATASEMAAGFTDGDQFEFIELINTSGTETLNLNGVSFANGIDAAFAGATQTIAGAGFDGGLGGYVFSANTFNGTSESGVASGTHDLTGGNGGGGSGGGAIRVDLESADSGPDHGPSSGAYQRTFSLASAGEVTIRFDYRFLYEGGFESDEVGQAIAELDGVRLGSAANGSLVSFTGDGNNGPASDTGWQSFTTTLSLGAGTHTLSLGAYYNKSTFSDEGVTAWFDNAFIEGATAPVGLAPGERALLVSDLAAFTERYGQAVVDSAAHVLDYDGNLANSGERVKLNDGNGSTILDFTYEDGADPGEEDWPAAADGTGPSLVVIDTEGDYSAGTNWTASTTTHGTPGSDEVATLAGDYNNDGGVTAADYTVWADTFGSTTDLRADGNGDGSITAADYTVWADNFGATSAAASGGASGDATGAQANVTSGDAASGGSAEGTSGGVTSGGVGAGIDSGESTRAAGGADRGADAIVQSAVVPPREHGQANSRDAAPALTANAAATTAANTPETRRADALAAAGAARADALSLTRPAKPGGEDTPRDAATKPGDAAKRGTSRHAPKRFDAMKMR